MALGPGRDSDISEGLPGEPLSPLIHTQTRGSSACPAPAMSLGLLGYVVFCFLQAGESWGAGSPSGVPALSLSAVTAVSVLLLHKGCPCWCLSDPRFQVVRRGPSMTLKCTQDLGHDCMYWYQQDLGHELRLIHYSAGVSTSEPGGVPDGYSVSRSSTENFPLMLEFANRSQTSVYFCASSYSMAMQGHLPSVQKTGVHVQAPSTGSLRALLARCLQSDPGYVGETGSNLTARPWGPCGTIHLCLSSAASM